VPAAIHLSPEALANGPIGKLRDGDPVRLDADNGELNVLVPAGEWSEREPAQAPGDGTTYGTGRELFAHMRAAVGSAEEGASVLF